MSNEPDNSPGLRLWGVGVSIVVLVVLAIWVRVSNIDEPLWVDELHTAWCIHDVWGEVVVRCSQGNQAPLYYLLLKVLQPVNVVALRSPSLIASAATIALTSLLVFRWTKSISALWLAGLLLVFQEHSVLFAQEARPYAWIQLVAVVFAFSLAERFRSDSPRWRAFSILSAIVLVHLHLTGGLLWLMGCVLLVRKELRRQLRVDLGICLIAIAPLIPLVLKVGARRSTWSEFIGQHSPHWLLFEQYQLMWIAVWPLLIALVIRLVGGMFAKQEQRVASRGPDFQFAALLCCWLLLPAAVSWAVTAADVVRINHPRYLIGVIPAACLLAGLACGWLRPRWLRVLFAVAIPAVFVWNVEPSTKIFQTRILRQQRDWSVTERYEDWDSAVKTIRDESTEDEPVFLCAGLIEDRDLLVNTSEEFRAYCLFPIKSFYQVDQPERLVHPLPTSLAGRFSQTHIKQLHEAGGGWLLIRASGGLVTEIENDLHEAHLKYGTQDLVVEERVYGVLWLVKLRVD